MFAEAAEGFSHFHSQVVRELRRWSAAPENSRAVQCIFKRDPQHVREFTVDGIGQTHEHNGSGHLQPQLPSLIKLLSSLDRFPAAIVSEPFYVRPLKSKAVLG